MRKDTSHRIPPFKGYILAKYDRNTTLIAAINHTK
jgi:hypothetical protein